MNSHHPLVLITGASSGIGLELAKCFAKDDYNLILTSEERVELEAAAEVVRGMGRGQVDIVEADLSQPGGALRVFDAVHRRRRALDVLVNNAGIGVYGKFTDTSLADEIAMIQLNVIATVRLTKLFVPAMVNRGAGRILFTASVTSTMPTPYLAAYGATQAFVHEFAQGLRAELHDTGVTVTSLMPDAGKLTDPPDVAMAVFTALMKGDDKVVVPLRYKLVPDTVVARQPARKHEPKHEERDEQR